MEPVVFAVLSLAACAFLTYVFLNFRRELAEASKKIPRHAKSYPAHLDRVERALQSARESLYGTREQRERARTAAAMRRETLISGIIGLLGILALFVVVMLLNSSHVWHH